MTVIGTVTIGQSPRVDIIPELEAILGETVDIVEAGALDGLSTEEIAAFAPKEGDYVLVTRLADGSSVQVAERHITPRIIEKINAHFANGIPLVFLLCTGEFPGFTPKGLLISPQKILFSVVSALAAGKRLAVMVPSPEQIPQSEHRWSDVTETVKSFPCSPYVNAEKELEHAAGEIKTWKADFVVLDCMGYSGEMQKRVREITGLPVVLGRGLAARVVREIIG